MCWDAPGQQPVAPQPLGLWKCCQGKSWSLYLYFAYKSACSWVQAILRAVEAVKIKLWCFQLDSVFNVQNRTRQYFCMSYINHAYMHKFRQNFTRFFLTFDSEQFCLYTFKIHIHFPIHFSVQLTEQNHLMLFH